MRTPEISSTSLGLDCRLLAALLSLLLAACGGEALEEEPGEDFLAQSGIAHGNLTSSITVLYPNGGERIDSNTLNTIRWSATGVTNVKVEVTVDGTAWTTVIASTSASSGQYGWGAPVIATNVAKVRVSDAANLAVSDTSNAPFTIATPGGGGYAFGSGVMINEVLVNELGTDVAREFVEVVNSGTTAQDLSGYTLWDGTGLRHTFPSGTALGAGRAVVVFGAASGIPAGLTNAVATSTGSLSLNNSGDTVTLKAPGGNVVDSVYVDAALCGTDAVSATRNPDATAYARFVLHTSLFSTVASPGKRGNQTAF